MKNFHKIFQHWKFDRIYNTKTKLKPKNIWLWVFGSNKPAIALYKKSGFKEFARYPKWVLHKGRYVDYIIMKLW